MRFFILNINSFKPIGLKEAYPNLTTGICYFAKRRNAESLRSRLRCEREDGEFLQVCSIDLPVGDEKYYALYNSERVTGRVVNHLDRVVEGDKIIDVYSTKADAAEELQAIITSSIRINSGEFLRALEKLSEAELS